MMPDGAYIRSRLRWLDTHEVSRGADALALLSFVGFSVISETRFYGIIPVFIFKIDTLSVLSMVFMPSFWGLSFFYPVSPAPAIGVG